MKNNISIHYDQLIQCSFVVIRSISNEILNSDINDGAVKLSVKDIAIISDLLHNLPEVYKKIMNNSISDQEKEYMLKRLCVCSSSLPSIMIVPVLNELLNYNNNPKCGLTSL